MDDLLDLSWQPTAPKAQSNPSSSSSSAARNNTNSNSSFGSTSSKPNYYGSSSAFGTSSSPRKQASSSPATAKATSNDDAFSSLFSSSTAKQQASLSLAERQKLATEQARQKFEDDKRRNDALWSGIDSSNFGGSGNGTSKSPSMPVAQRVTSPPSNANTAKQASDPWDFDAFSSAVPATKPASPSKSTAPAAAAQSRSHDPFDFDSFDQPFSSAPSVAVHTDTDQQADDILGALAMPVTDAPKQSLSALDPRVAGLSSSTATSSAGSSRVPSPASGSRPTARRSAPARGSSPPPHVIGQIVEMGFSPQQARQALGRTDTGVNVEAALELLVGNGGASHRVDEDDERLARKLQANEQRHARASFRDSDDEDDAELQRQTRRNQREQRERQQSNNDPRVPRRAQAAGGAGATNDMDSEAAADWQQQADQLYAQASEIGSSVLNKASAFWSSAKAQAQKALDERNRAAAAERSNTPSDAGSERHRARRWGASSTAAKQKEWTGKPKWMIDAELAEAGASSNGTDSHDSKVTASADEPAQLGGFKDSDNEDDAPAPPEPPTRASRRPAAAVTASAGPTAGVAAAAAAMSSAASALWGGSKPQDTEQSVSQPPPSLPARSSAAATAAAAAKTGYISPNRRGTPSRSAAPSPIPPKAPLKRRPIPSDASHSISSANRNKQEGNDHFKRGAYGDAEASYTRGISALESSSSSSESIRLVPLLSNRANVRLKNGDAAGTIADCDQLLAIVLSLFGGSQRDSDGRIAVYRASQEAALPAELADINLRETYGKALVRRAQALEANERWKLAKADWEVLLEYEKAEGSGVKTAASNMKFAREGLYRCGKMLGEKVVGSAVSTGPAKKPVNASRTTGAASAEKASAAFASQQQAQAAEESARFALKDSVDAKIDNWKRGKETNLRALLSSLDTIVWPELGWKPIALHQVLDANGLKKNYTKAIARLHPDKIKKGATVEQQMIAGAAFHALNEAWNAQQG